MAAARGGHAPDPVQHGFPHLETVRAAITAMYRRLSWETVRGYAVPVAPADVAFTDGEDLHLGAQRVARALVRHFRLPDARMVVAFHDMEDAADVELAAGPEYFVELNTRFAAHRRDVGAALAHEVAHVYLHRAGLAFAGVRDNEILTDTVTTYLGAGWLLLDAFRQDALTSQKLGYLTPEEFGYVLAKRAGRFGEDPSVWFTSPQAYDAYVRGRAQAREDERRPPLAGSGPAARLRYTRDRRLARSRLAAAAPGAPLGGGPPAGGAPGAGGNGRSGHGGYAFHAGSPLRVSFPCPVCGQRIRVPVRGRVRVRCALCTAVLDCDT